MEEIIIKITPTQTPDKTWFVRYELDCKKCNSVTYVDIEDFNKVRDINDKIKNSEFPKEFLCKKCAQIS